ncbi:MAG: Trm112 family protein [Deltaproteobacteria bacterium]|nr:Trm112 family protein [Candidatus Anaeroferrophillus wilburensis]MBN2889046.1 Trm112 family protein [Deltaproteobacteria bacterium]
MVLNHELMNLLVCPQCKKELELTADEQWLLCHSCQLRYPIRNDIPVMLIDEAESMAAKEQ